MGKNVLFNVSGEGRATCKAFTEKRIGNILKKAFREAFKPVDEPNYEKYRGQKNMLNDTTGRQSAKSRLPKVYKTNDLISSTN